jgi:hypothetical protein
MGGVGNMKKIKCFEREESASYPGKYLIKPIYDNFHLTGTEGSYNVICARVMGLSYAQYLRMCRDCFGAEIIGKGHLYPLAYFKMSNQLLALIEDLNARANLILWEREHPDHEKHLLVVKENSPRYFEEVKNNANNLRRS